MSGNTRTPHAHWRRPSTLTQLQRHCHRGKRLSLRVLITPVAVTLTWTREEGQEGREDQLGCRHQPQWGTPVGQLQENLEANHPIAYPSNFHFTPFRSKPCEPAARYTGSCISNKPHTYVLYSGLHLRTRPWAKYAINPSSGSMEPSQRGVRSMK